MELGRGDDAMSTTLRDRCKEVYQKLQRDGILRQGDPVQTILEFVLSETGRAADAQLEQSLPLVLYFATDADRNHFVEAVKGMKPGMVSRKLP